MELRFLSAILIAVIRFTLTVTAGAGPDPAYKKFALQLEYKLTAPGFPSYTSEVDTNFYLTTIPYPGLQGTLALPQENGQVLHQLVVRVDKTHTPQPDYGFYRGYKWSDQHYIGRYATVRNQGVNVYRDITFMTADTNDLNVPWGHRKPSWLPFFGTFSVKGPKGINKRKYFKWTSEHDVNIENNKYFEPRRFGSKTQWIVCSMPFYEAKNEDGKTIWAADIYFNDDGNVPDGCQSTRLIVREEPSKS